MTNIVIDRPPVTFQQPVTKKVLKRPPLYQVYMSASRKGFRQGDGLTFAPIICFRVLQDVFHKTNFDDHRTLWEIFHTGTAMVFEGTREIAETKTMDAKKMIRTHHDLCVMARYYRVNFETRKL